MELVLDFREDGPGTMTLSSLDKGVFGNFLGLLRIRTISEVSNTIIDIGNFFKGPLIALSDVRGLSQKFLKAKISICLEQKYTVKNSTSI